jgi:hypothetical protein
LIVKNDEAIRYGGNLGQEILVNAEALDELAKRHGLRREVYGSPPTSVSEEIRLRRRLLNRRN